MTSDLTSMRATTTILLAFLATSAQAFKGPEHFQLSNLALWLAAEQVCPGPPDDQAGCAEAAALLAAASPEPDAPGPAELSFGAYTRAGDYFTKVAKIVPDPECCVAGEREGCPRALFDDCRVNDGACHAPLLTWAVNRIQDRHDLRFLLHRLLALHQNTGHFREFAAYYYSALHERAVRHAREGRHDLALRTEALALHFLQDLFAPGHLASARADVADPASAFLHDRGNRRGALFLLRPAAGWCGEVNALEAALRKPRRDLPRPLDRAIELGGEDLAALRRVLGSCADARAGGLYHAFGDGNLLDGPILDGDRRAHRTFLVLASAASVRQVLERPAADDDLLTICFQRQSGVPERLQTWLERAREQRSGAAQIAGAGEPEAPEAATSAQDPLDPPEPVLCRPASPRPRRPDLGEPTVSPLGGSMWLPGAVLTRRGAMPLDPVRQTCYPDLEGALAGYATRPAEGPPEAVQPSGISDELSVLEVAWSPLHWGKGAGGHASRRLELAWTILGTLPESEIEQRDPDSERLTGTVFSRLQRDIPVTASIAVHGEEHREYDVLAAGLLFTGYTKLGRHGTFDLYGILEPGYGYYENDVRSAARWRGSARAGLGASMLFFEVGAERGFAIDETGDGHREWRYFAGVRTRISTTWFARLAR